MASCAWVTVVCDLDHRDKFEGDGGVGPEKESSRARRRAGRGPRIVPFALLHGDRRRRAGWRHSLEPALLPGAGAGELGRAGDLARTEPASAGRELGTDFHLRMVVGINGERSRSAGSAQRQAIGSDGNVGGRFGRRIAGAPGGRLRSHAGRRAVIDAGGDELHGLPPAVALAGLRLMDWCGDDPHPSRIAAESISREEMDRVRKGRTGRLRVGTMRQEF